jgi:DNA helicase-2/ATP-dependent DNA helicase PcrA
MDFTSEQTEIIQHERGNVVVIAGAGSGKTRCLVERTATLIDKGYNPPSILIFTFTRKAALEISSRVADRLGQEDLEVQTSTIHSLALKIFRDNSELLGYSDQPTIWSPNRRGTIVSNGIKHFLEVPKTHTEAMLETGYMGFSFTDRTAKLKEILEKNKKKNKNEKKSKLYYEEDEKYIEHLKSQIKLVFDEFPPYPYRIDGVSPNAYYQKLIDADYSPDVATLAAEFKTVKDACVAIEFDDMIPAAIRILHIGCDYNSLYCHIMIDEYQDVNKVNVDFVKALSGESIVSVMAVGDDDQSIYGFRGGNVQHILNFAEEFNGSTMYLTQNFRSTPEIIELANRVISNNHNRYPKIMRPARENRSSNMIVTHEPAWTVDYSERIMETQFQQYEDVYHYIQGLIYFVEEQPENIAILARNNFNLRMAYSVFKRLNKERNQDIPFDLTSIKSPFEKPVVKSIIMWANILLYPTDYVNCREALMHTVKGFGGRTAEYFTSYAKSEPDGNVVSWLQGLSKFPRHGSKTKKYSLISSIAQRIQKHLELITTVDILGFWILAMDCAGVHRYAMDKKLLADRSASVARQFEGNEELLAIAQARDNIRDFMDTLEKDKKNDCKHLMDHIATEISVAQDAIGVQMMTIHASKGKEWPIVFLIDLVDSVIPSPQSTDLEEERRLLYVGITRAEDEVHLSYFDKDIQFEPVNKSSFWAELQIPPDNTTEWLREIIQKNKERQNASNNF